MTTTTPRAVVISFNWLTKEILYIDFEGENAARDAEGWADKESFIWRDFPAKAGWTHFAYWNKRAGRLRGQQAVQALDSGEPFTISVPK